MYVPNFIAGIHEVVFMHNNRIHCLLCCFSGSNMVSIRNTCITITGYWHSYLLIGYVQHWVLSFSCLFPMMWLMVKSV